MSNDNAIVTISCPLSTLKRIAEALTHASIHAYVEAKTEHLHLDKSEYATDADAEYLMLLDEYVHEVEVCNSLAFNLFYNAQHKIDTTDNVALGF